MREGGRPGAAHERESQPGAPPVAPPASPSSGHAVSGPAQSNGASRDGAPPRPAPRSGFEASLQSARATASAQPSPNVPESAEIEALRAAGASIGRGVVLEPGAFVDDDFAWLVTIEDEVVLGSRAQVLAHDGATRHALGHDWAAPVRIGAGAYVGAGATILPGVSIGPGAVIGAGSIVSRDVEAETVVAGIPARAICSVRELIARHEPDIVAAKAAGLWGITTLECRDPEHRAELMARMRHISRIYVR